jgi:hypothetical protein
VTGACDRAVFDRKIEKIYNIGSVDGDRIYLIKLGDFMHKALIVNSDFNNPAPTAKEMQSFLNKSGKLIYSEDKRKSKNTPYQKNIHLVVGAFRDLEEAITGNEREYCVHRNLYIFDGEVNEMLFYLKFSGMVQCHFILNDSIIEDMNKASWDYGHLNRFKKSLEDNVHFNKFMVERNIGDSSLYDALHKFSKATDDYILEVNNSIKQVEEKAIALFKSGW